METAHKNARQQYGKYSSMNILCVWYGGGGDGIDGSGGSNKGIKYSLTFDKQTHDSDADEKNVYIFCYRGGKYEISTGITK